MEQGHTHLGIHQFIGYSKRSIFDFNTKIKAYMTMSKDERL
jgi:hypothetical protein